MSKSTKQPTVAERWEMVLEILQNGKVSKKVQSELEALLAPKSASSVNPPLEDSEGNITHYWDRWFNQYVTIEESVLSNGKPKGYSKASLSKWNKMQAKVKELMMDLAFSGMTREEVEEELKQAQKATNSPESFNYDEDTYRFNNKKKYEVEWVDGKWVTNDLPDDEEEEEA